jgi:hypothetical protein
MASRCAYLVFILGLVLLLLAAGCGGSSATTEPGTSQPGGSSPVVSTPGGLDSLLPPPSSLVGGLTGARQASYTEANLEILGNNYGATLPKNRQATAATAVELSPDWAAGAPISGLAYCTYHFIADGYDRNAQLRLTFSGTLPATGNVWVAFANWNADRWQWFGGGTQVSFVGNEARLNTGSFAPYFDFGGNMLCVVAVTGASPALYTLGTLRLGALPPVPALSATPEIGSVPLSVTLDASASTTPEGTITSYEWDADGDGVFESNTGATDTSPANYTTNQEYHPVVRVTNSFGAKATATATVQAVGDWSHTWGRSEADEIRRVVVDSEGNIYGVGTNYKTSGPLESDLLLTKWTPTGKVVWAKTFDSGDSDYGLDVQLDSDGNLIVSGGTDISGSRDVLISKWTPAGAVIWAKRSGGANFEQALNVVVDGTDIYLAGSSSSLSATNDVFVLKYLPNGALDWEVACDHGDSDYLTDLTTKYSFLSGTTGLIAVFEYVSGADYNICKIEYDLSGALVSAKNLGTVAQPKHDAQIIRTYSFSTFQASYYVGGIIDNGIGDRVFLSKTDGTGANVYCTLITPPNTPQIHDMSFDSQGNIFLTGFGKTAGAFSDALLYKFDPATGDYLSAYAWGLQDHQNRGYGLYPYYGGLLLTGYGIDTTASWIEPFCTASSTSLSFTDTIIFNPGISWFANDVLNTVEDITAEGVLDTGGGGDDCLLLHRAGI